MPIVDRMSRDFSKYIQFCLICFIETMMDEIMPKMMSSIKKAIDFP